MLRHKVLVFGVDSVDNSETFDLVSSIREVLLLWGPGELEVGRCISRGGAEHFTVNAAEIGGGVLQPVKDNPEQLFPMWHWSADGLPAADTGLGQPVDLDTRIRIGQPSASNLALGPSASMAAQADYTACAEHQASNATSYAQTLCQFYPVGPARENPSCPYANLEADITRRGDMAEFLKEPGTHEPYYETTGYDVGSQLGSHAMLQFMMKRERRPASNVKCVLLRQEQSPEEVLANLDKVCGLIISNCTDVMARARVRDLVAFVGPVLHKGKFPILKKHPNLDESIRIIIRALQDTENFSEWASTQTDQEDKPLSQSPMLRDLVLAVLWTLGKTGLEARPLELRAVDLYATICSAPW
ncbi:hypothetical protein DL769_010733 [Monosporascus sp. CRB-8-3]|nr:hypothetical protein DL769_010733 [Monosporascus sp. CRB-8-3]